MKFDFDDLTLEEVEILEEVSGVAMDAIASVLAPKDGNPRPKGRLLTAMAFVAARRENPDITLEEVRKMKVSAIVGDGVEVEPARPTEASGR